MRKKNFEGEQKKVSPLTMQNEFLSLSLATDPSKTKEESLTLTKVQEIPSSITSSGGALFFLRNVYYSITTFKKKRQRESIDLDKWKHMVTSMNIYHVQATYQKRASKTQGMYCCTSPADEISGGL